MVLIIELWGTPSGTNKTLVGFMQRSHPNEKKLCINSITVIKINQHSICIGKCWLKGTRNCVIVIPMYKKDLQAIFIKAMLSISVTSVAVIMNRVLAITPTREIRQRLLDRYEKCKT